LGVAVASLLEEFARGPDRLLDLPQRRPPIEAERVQRANGRQRGDFVAANTGPADEIVE
jgi:hypothetical protein